jgi:hypothetical protein
MKLTGSVKSVLHRVAKKTDEGIQEKRCFNIDVSPARPDTSWDYAYGSMQFTLHGRELDDFEVALGDDVEVLLVKADTVYEGKELEDTRRELYLLMRKHEELESNYNRLKESTSSKEREVGGLRSRLQAMQIENVKLLTEVMTFKQMFKREEVPTMISVGDSDKTI